MTDLHELRADDLLAKLQQRGEEWAQAKYQATLLEGSYDRMKAQKANVFKAQGATVDGAKNSALNDDAVVQAFTDWIEAELKKDECYIKLERVRAAVEMWRSEQANRRRV